MKSNRLKTLVSGLALVTAFSGCASNYPSYTGYQVDTMQSPKSVPRSPYYGSYGSYNYEKDKPTESGGQKQ